MDSKKDAKWPQGSPTMSTSTMRWVEVGWPVAVAYTVCQEPSPVKGRPEGSIAAGSGFYGRTFPCSTG